ncbi:MAG: lytic transglycosylase domain-containing protein [Alphaproteobacteria bacterium]|nr:MAG: lytic transglycosylase domain-containing protein [Alphaproteobacteria bacterium]
MMKALLLAAALALPGAPAMAMDDDSGRSAERAEPPRQLNEGERAEYRAIFQAIHDGRWTDASARLDALPDGVLKNVALAEMYLAPGSPRVEKEPILALLERAPELPEAPQLARLAKARGVEELPLLPQPQAMIFLGGQPRRVRAKSTKNDPVAAELDPLIQPLIVADHPADAELLLQGRETELSPEALTEFRQRIAWSYYLIGDDGSARRIAGLARSGAGDWVVQAHWTVGLAAWRAGDCKEAADAFSAVAATASDPELNAAGHYWAARAEMVCVRPERVQPHLRTAARMGETFYGLLSASALGMKDPTAALLHDYRDSEWRGIANKPNVRAAIALMEVGERALADTFVSWQARIGSATDHNGLLHLAADLDLAGTQFWLAHNAPAGARVNMSARYPRPEWKPVRGWRVDQSLAYAHALQESNFRTQTVSPAGAMGLMQVRPGTAGDIARARGEPFSASQLSEPAANLEFGQTFLETLRDNSGTGGLLPKVIAAYNAGPVPVAQWNTRRMDNGDPLLYIESIPYWETRGYVPSVLRNYWIYEQEAGRSGGSREALAQGMWPRFPGMPGARAVRMQPDKAYASSTD